MKKIWYWEKIINTLGAAGAYKWSSAINTLLFEKFLFNLTNKAQLSWKYADLFAAALVRIVSPMMSFSLQAKHFLIYCLLFFQLDFHIQKYVTCK